MRAPQQRNGWSALACFQAITRSRPRPRSGMGQIGHCAARVGHDPGEHATRRRGFPFSTPGRSRIIHLPGRGSAGGRGSLTEEHARVAVRRHECRRGTLKSVRYEEQLPAASDQLSAFRRTSAEADAARCPLADAKRRQRRAPRKTAFSYQLSDERRHECRRGTLRARATKDSYQRPAFSFQT